MLRGKMDIRDSSKAVDSWAEDHCTLWQPQERYEGGGKKGTSMKSNLVADLRQVQVAHAAVVHLLAALEQLVQVLWLAGPAASVAAGAGGSPHHVPPAIHLERTLPGTFASGPLNTPAEATTLPA